MRILLFSVAHPGARTWCHALPWWALRCGYPHEPPAANKNTLIMIMRSRRRGRTFTKGRAGREMG